MQRYRTLTIHCGNADAATQMLQKIILECNIPPFVYEKDDKRLQYDKTIRIISTYPNLPEAIIVVIVSDNNVKIINIVPHKKSVFRIEKNEYNTIMRYFKEKIIDKIVSEDRIDFPPAEYSMESLIPQSFKELVTWVNCSDSNAPFSHPLDLNRWFDFVIALQMNSESDNLSSGDLEQWLEEKNWDEEVIEETILNYEHDTELLNYFRKQQNCLQ